jgi:hypothetical protein
VVLVQVGPLLRPPPSGTHQFRRSGIVSEKFEGHIESTVPTGTVERLTFGLGSLRVLPSSLRGSGASGDAPEFLQDTLVGGIMDSWAGGVPSQDRPSRPHVRAD